MISRGKREVWRLNALLAISALAVAAAGCTSIPGLDPEATSQVAPAKSPERAAAVAEMRARAEAGDSMPFPDVFQSAQVTRLAQREEPRSVPDVQAIEAELTIIAERRAASRDATEIAALDARARELRRLALAAGKGELR